MLTRDLTPCFVQDFGLGSRTGYEKALLVGLFDRTFTCLDRRISATDEAAGPTRRPVAVVMRRDGRLQEVDPWKVVIECPECKRTFELEIATVRTYRTKRRIEDMPDGWNGGEL